MSHIGQYSLTKSLPNMQIGHEGMSNNGIQSIVMPKTVADKKTSSQEDGSSNKAKRKTTSTTSRNKASTTKAEVIINPHPKIPIGKMKTGTGKLKKKPKGKRQQKPKPKQHTKNKPQDKKAGAENNPY